jgi:hypothetical protein
MANNDDHEQRERQAQQERERHAQQQQQQQQRQRRQAPSAEDKAAADRAANELRERRAAASIGGQVILDYNEDAALGARGGAGGTIEENQRVRDEHLVEMGLDPVSPSGPPPSPEVLQAKRQREEEEAKAAERGEQPRQSPKATRHSSLAAGLDADR